jgi:hypothetical protein
MLFFVIGALIVALGIAFSLYLEAHGKYLRERQRADDATTATINLASALAHATRDRFEQILRNTDAIIAVRDASHDTLHPSKILYEVSVAFRGDPHAALSLRFHVSSDGGQGWIHVSDQAMTSKTAPIENFFDVMEAAEVSITMHQNKIIDVMA